MKRSLALVACMFLAATAVFAKSRLHKIGAVHIPVLCLAARVELWELAIERNTPGQVRITVTFSDGTPLSDADATATVRGSHVAAELFGAGMTEPQTLPVGTPPDDPLVLKIPPLSADGTYQLSNLRLVANGKTLVDVSPGYMIIRVVEPAHAAQPGSGVR